MPGPARQGAGAAHPGCPASSQRGPAPPPGAWVITPGCPTQLPAGRGLVRVPGPSHPGCPGPPSVPPSDRTGCPVPRTPGARTPLRACVHFWDLVPCIPFFLSFHP